MAKVDFMAAMAEEEKRGSYSSDGVQFFSLKDGEEVTVRIMVDTLDDLEAFAVHTVRTAEGRYRTVNCLREAHDPINTCPLCAAGERTKNVVVLKMLQYDEQGGVTPVVWERNLRQWGPQIKSYLDNYGPLSNIMCKISRQGIGLDTNYSVIPNLNPQKYNTTDYPINPDAFAEYRVLGRSIADKSAEDLNIFLATGNFPAKQQNDNNQYQQAPQQNYAPNPGYGQAPNYVDDTPFAPASPQQNFGAQPTMARPNRQY